MPDGKELGGKGGRARHAAVVATELNKEEDEEAAQGANRRYVEEVVHVAIPGGKRVSAVVVPGGWRKRARDFHGENPKSNKPCLPDCSEFTKLSESLSEEKVLKSKENRKKFPLYEYYYLSQTK
ncbi:hypothetical protein RIF29_34181 [Crotalaria pallida]|uniref:Uncharacterized protein n=1 Tax=Crotalaria pallida TaxID=3830 RepID=A0AAN9HX95_CROPI